MQRIALVTGGAGFIGSHVADRVSAAGYRVRVLDDFSTGRRANLSALPAEADVVDGDVRDTGLLRRVMAGVDVVFHHAALVSVPGSVEDPIPTHEVNAGGTLAMLIASRDAHVGRVVYAASSSAYASRAEGPISEDDPPSPTSPYGVAKLAGERYCHAFTATYGLPTVSLRYFNVFGPRQDVSSGYAAVIPAFAAALLEGRSPVVFGDGLQSRDFIHVADVAQANVLAAAAPEEATGAVYNIGSGRAHSIIEVLDGLRELIGGGPSAVFEAPRSGDIRHSCADVSAARRMLGFRATVAFGDGLRDVVRWLESHREGLG